MTVTTPSKTKHYPRPPISLIESNIPHWGVNIYIGGSVGTANPDLLKELDIKIVLNCAVNLDIDWVDQLDPNYTGDTKAFGAGPVRYYKLGLIDGPGNTAEMILAGYYLMRSALNQTIPDKPSYKNRELGNILVNCRGGRSRSVTIVALFLHLEMPEKYPTLEAAIAHIRHTRELHPDEWFETPKPMLVDLAKQAVAMHRAIRQVIAE
ncbi:protein phosphatase [Vibrio sp. CAIM 722]|uniref:Protein phosphatase n=2 Tax=Vibrio TaxID=662 RepID=A0A7X4LGW0_9VIBR|nr:dual specificity protein phosphatase family protein [Vibrio eleionomae]MZI91631.1 protein phosphatase [Vibrio eleionomae]